MRSKLGWPVRKCLLRSRSRHTCLFRNFAGDLCWWINGGRAVMQNMLRGKRRERDGKREVAALSRRARLPTSKNPAGADCRSLSSGGMGWGRKKWREGGSTWQGRSKDRPEAYMFVYLFIYFCWNYAALWLQPSTSAHCCCIQRPLAAASEGETRGSLFNSWGLKALRHHPFRQLLQRSILWSHASATGRGWACCARRWTQTHPNTFVLRRTSLWLLTSTTVLKLTWPLPPN